MADSRNRPNDDDPVGEIIADAARLDLVSVPKGDPKMPALVRRAVAAAVPIAEAARLARESRETVQRWVKDDHVEDSA